jgi:uncharacterized protein (TIGR02231 family)
MAINSSKRFCLYVFTLAAMTHGISAAAPGERTVAAKVTAVTVFTDRAQVVRTCSETLQAGEHELVFDNLPQSVERTSLAMEGSGSGTLREVKFRQETPAEEADSLSLALEKRKRRLEEEVGGADDRIKQRTSEKQFLENIALKVTDRSGGSERASPPELDTLKWQKMASFYRNRLDALTREIRETGRLKRDLTDSLAAVNRAIADLGRSAGGTRNQAVVTLYMKEQGRISLNLSYIVYGPSWTPAYELRVASAKKRLKMTYKGRLRQNTGEDWTYAEIRLSTARAYIGGTQPELSPWHINFYSPAPYPQYSLAMKPKAKRLAAAPPMAQMMEAGAPAKEDLEMAPEPSLAVADAGVESGALSAVFAIPGKTTVASDNQEHTVAIMTRDFPATFRYSTVPKLAARAYLKAKAVNGTDFPLLRGATSVFLDNSFVANSTLDNVAPGEEFWTFLGVDEAVKVEYKRLNRLEKDKGFIGKKRKVEFDYLITVTNNRKTDEEIVAWDQLPIPGDGDIKVELVEPKYRENTDALKKNETQYLEWYFRMKPGQKITIPFKFTVEYPEGKTVTGL